MALNDINKDELQAFAEEVGVDSDGKKDKIVERLEGKGYTEEDVESFQEGTFEASSEEGDANQTDPDPDATNKRVEEAVGVVADGGDESDEEEKILIKLDGPFSSITTNGVRFTQDHPFVPVKRSVAEELLKSRAFRQAHPGEADEFYG